MSAGSVHGFLMFPLVCTVCSVRRCHCHCDSFVTLVVRRGARRFCVEPVFSIFFILFLCSTAAGIPTVCAKQGMAKDEAATFHTELKAWCVEEIKKHVHPELKLVLENVGPHGEADLTSPEGRLTNPGACPQTGSCLGVEHVQVFVSVVVLPAFGVSTC